MTDAATDPQSPAEASSAESPPSAGPGYHESGLAKLTLGAIGVVFGDIGTSPIYAFRETFAGHHPLTPDAEHI
ncbi:MAG TPA: KUP/HAK/KT family potassium transporter, partial [Allosphingosinicella sp.]